MDAQLEKKVSQAIKLIQSASKIAAQNGCPEIELGYSAGKDSDVILELTKMANVPYRAIYKNTTIDPPGTIRHALENGAEIIHPKMTFREIIEKSGLPSRFRRACCRYLKEYKILDYTVLGIRADESAKRKKLYKEPEQCRVYSKKEKVRQYLPILNWTSEDVAEFIAERGIKCHPLYYDEQGRFHSERRLGCLGCPLASHKTRIAQFKEYPRLVKFYVRGGQKYLELHPDSKVHGCFKDAYEWFVMSLFCDSMAEFRERFGQTLFAPPVDCKKFLEDYFKIKF